MKLLIGGDVCITEDSLNIYNHGGLNNLFQKELIKMFKETDFSIINIECPMTEFSNPILKCGPNNKISNSAISILSDLQVTHASLANNHILDYGMEGMEETLDSLISRDIKPIGISYDNQFSCILSKSDINVGIISFADDEFNGFVTENGPINLYDPLTSFDMIKKLKEKCDYVVVLFHIGLEHYEYPTPNIQRICRKMVECGADFVTCQHSHCIGAFEKIGNCYILYGQGNFHFFRKNNNEKKWNNAILVELNFSKNKLEKPFWHFVNLNKGCLCLNEDVYDVVENFEKRSQEIRDKKFVNERFEGFCMSKMQPVELQLLRGSSNLNYYFNKLTNCRFVSATLPQKKSIGMSNVIRCSVHNEVIKCILKKINYNYNSKTNKNFINKGLKNG